MVKAAGLVTFGQKTEKVTTVCGTLIRLLNAVSSAQLHQSKTNKILLMKATHKDPKRLIMASKFGQKAVTTKAISRTIRNMAKELTGGQMDRVIREVGRMTK
jgi:Zn-dependent alcohol dehydrogenase